MKTEMNIVDLALHAASICQFCRQGQRPFDDSDNEHGDAFRHRRQSTPNQSDECSASQIWVLIRRMER